eukprot:4874531-Pleurochrysis_carterae.AAC.1
MMVIRSVRFGGGAAERLLSRVENRIGEQRRGSMQLALVLSCATSAPGSRNCIRRNHDPIQNRTCIEEVPFYHTSEFNWKKPDYHPSPSSALIEQLQPHMTMSSAEGKLLQLDLTHFTATAHHFNPFVMDYGNNVLYNIQNRGTANKTDFPGIAMTKIVWIKRGGVGPPTVWHTILDAEDARAV